MENTPCEKYEKECTLKDRGYDCGGMIYGYDYSPFHRCVTNESSRNFFQCAYVKNMNLVETNNKLLEKLK